MRRAPRGSPAIPLPSALSEMRAGALRGLFMEPGRPEGGPGSSHLRKMRGSPPCPRALGSCQAARASLQRPGTSRGLKKNAVSECQVSHWPPAVCTPDRTADASSQRPAPDPLSDAPAAGAPRPSLGKGLAPAERGRRAGSRPALQPSRPPQARPRKVRRALTSAHPPVPRARGDTAILASPGQRGEWIWLSDARRARVVWRRRRGGGKVRAGATAGRIVGWFEM